MPGSKQQQELGLIKELQHILDSSTLELAPVDEVWSNLYIGNVWVSCVIRAYCKELSVSDRREKIICFISLFYCTAIIPWYCFSFLPVFSSVLCVSPGLLHRTERHYITWASLMSWMLHTPNRAASETRVFMETLVFTSASRQRIQKVSTSASTSNLQLTSYTMPWRTKMVQ